MTDFTIKQRSDSGAVAEQTRTSPIPLGRPDKYIWATYVFICIISIIELYSASSREVGINSSFGVLGPVVRHATLLLIGLGIMLFLQSRHYRDIRLWTIVFVAISVGLMVYVIFWGEIVNNARRSLTIMGFQLQPAEFIKLSSVLVVAMIMARSQLRKGVGVSDRGLWTAAAFILFFSALLAKQGLTNTLLLMTISLSIMLIGGVRLKKLGLVLICYGVCAALFIAYLSLKPDDVVKTTTEVVMDSNGQIVTQEVPVETMQEGNRLGTWQARIARFTSGGDSIPKYRQKINAENRQEMYAYMAQANSRGIGVGPGNSRESARLPLAFSDFIFSIIVEDLGLAGALFVLILYLCLLGRASGIASRCSRAYPAMLVIGMAVMIVAQALVHMAINVGVAPVSGQPLPLISKGGSSIIITSIALGIMLSVSRYAASSRNKRQEIKQELDVLPEEISAENPTQL